MTTGDARPAPSRDLVKHRRVDPGGHRLVARQAHLAGAADRQHIEGECTRIGARPFYVPSPSPLLLHAGRIGFARRGGSDVQYRAVTGCPYLRALLEADPQDRAGTASRAYLEDIRTSVEAAATLMGLVDPDDFARCWLTLMQGTVVSAVAGDTHGGARMRRLGETLITLHTPADTVAADHTTPISSAALP